MFNRFTKDARAVVTAAEEEARSSGARSIEAEHLLLACTSSVTELAEAGLGHDALAAALEASFTANLRSVGVPAELSESAPLERSVGKLRFGTSAKIALEQTLKAAMACGDRRIESRHVALGVLRARRGTVPRALSAAGIDRDELSSRI